jgi:hypothetical protein
MTLDEVLEYATKQQLDEPEEAALLIERLAPVILGDLALLRSALSNAWRAGRSDDIEAIVSEHAAEVATQKCGAK